jgi:hypothetical protein
LRTAELQVEFIRLRAGGLTVCIRRHQAENSADSFSVGQDHQ